jgi:hypothetical protein
MPQLINTCRGRELPVALAQRTKLPLHILNNEAAKRTACAVEELLQELNRIESEV